VPLLPRRCEGVIAPARTAPSPARALPRDPATGKGRAAEGQRLGVTLGHADSAAAAWRAASVQRLVVGGERRRCREPCAAAQPRRGAACSGLLRLCLWPQNACGRCAGGKQPRTSYSDVAVRRSWATTAAGLLRAHAAAVVPVRELLDASQVTRVCEPSTSEELGMIF